MSDLNKTATANRLHIGIYGKRNMGKSTIINALTNQNIAIVSDYAGTTTDPVYKAMEILPIGPVVIIDTAGIDDIGEIGKLRVKKSMDTIKKTDIALLIIDAKGLADYDLKLIDIFKDQQIPFIIIINKSDLNRPDLELINQLTKENYPHLTISAINNHNIEQLKKEIIHHSPKAFEQPTIIGDLISPGDHVVLVTPIDTGMPKGRLILPQVQTIRDILDNDGIIHICKERELRWTLDNLVDRPKIVITDSQAFSKVSADTPPEIMLTSFSILFAKYKGDLLKLVEGAKVLKNLKPFDKILISEACTHHAQPDDIGKVKIPRWIRQHIDPEIEFEFCNGRDYPDNLKDYKLVIHCGACTLNRKEMLHRIESSNIQGVPVVNYGLTIAYLQGIFERALKPFPEIYHIWKDLHE